MERFASSPTNRTDHGEAWCQYWKSGRSLCARDGCKNGGIAAELKSNGGRTELILYSAAQKQALAIGVDQIRQLKYIDFLDDSGSPQGGWTQGGKSGEGTIYIADNQKPNSVCLEADQRELGEIHRPVERWGLWVAPGNRHSGDGALYSTLAPDKSQWIAGFHIWNNSREFSIIPGFKQSPLDALWMPA